MSLRLISFFSILVSVTFASCKNYKNEMLDWGHNIPTETALKEVQLQQPAYIQVDWHNPDTLNTHLIRYPILQIQGNYDFLKMSYYLEFDSLGYRGIFGNK